MEISDDDRETAVDGVVEGMEAATTTTATTTRLHPTHATLRLARNRQRAHPLVRQRGVLDSGPVRRPVRPQATPWATAIIADRSMGKPVPRVGLEMVEDGLLGLQEGGLLGVEAVEERVPHRRLAGRGMNLRGLAEVEGGRMDVVRDGF